MSNNIKNMPTFRGRFGTRSKRRKTNDKWDKWRFPRGIDITWRRGDNQMPKAGFGGDKSTRDLHPSGRVEVYINNLPQLEKYVKENKETNKVIFRIASTVGAKKRLLIKAFVEKNKLRAINLTNVKEKVKTEKKDDKSKVEKPKEHKIETKKDEKHELKASK